MHGRKEKWKPCHEWPEYQVSSLGRVRRDGRVLKLVPVQSGANSNHKPLYVSFSRPGIYPRHCPKFKVAILVLRAFRGPSKEGQIARHLDDNQTNNWLTNLRWGTHAANGRDRITNGRVRRGAENGNAKLTPAKVKAIKIFYQFRSRGRGLLATSRKFKVSISTIHAIVAGKTWKEI